MIDTHAHLENTLCDIDLGEVSKVILAASNLEDSKSNIENAIKNSRLYPACGIHPQDTSADSKMSIIEQLNLLENTVKNDIKIIVAIGECGLDFSPVIEGEKERGIDDQKEIFLGQIKIAIKYNLPLIIHARKAVDEVVDILKDFPEASGVFHCYAGGKKKIQKVLDLGNNWYFGIDGNLTYEDGLVEVVKNIPKDKLLLETDSPFLTPTPFRGQKNEPKYIKYIYEKVAEIWGMKMTEVEKIIDQNASTLFSKTI